MPLWATVLPDGQGEMTWPPELVASSGGHAEGADSQPGALRKLQKENTPGSLKKERGHRTVNGSEGDSSDWGKKDG